ncbi:radical SAM protein [Sphingomonas oryzagri]|uniref:Radical SAM protein n=1 Tax=Sphingomonas oryzagri TaxID=3042314 RepID=A0ABT6MZ76_9SPHN|nr:radical SAM protein [Sphingomonas oryzagri]MDH7638102.1 radical SAM protein [Sphingomonas oryzagri]
MKQHHIFIASTEWGGSTGGINLFNKSLVEALARVVGDRVKIHAAVTSGDAGLPVGLAASIEFLDYDGTGISLAKAIEGTLPVTGDRPSLHIFGHDVHTGAHAIEARDLLKRAGYDVRAATVCHMDYSAYEHLKDTDAGAILDKAQRQRDIVCAADDVYAVGPLLCRNFERLRQAEASETRVHQIIPGFPNAFVDRAQGNPSLALKFFFSGRIDPALDRLKNSRLVLRSLVKAYENGSKDPESRWRQRGQFFCYGFQAGSDHRDWYCDDLSEQALKTHFTLHMEDFAGQEPMFRQLRDSHVAIMPSTHEGFGLAGWEALCAGVPLICSEQSGLALFLQNLFARDHDLPSESVVMVRLTEGPDDEATLAGAMHELARAYERRRSHAEKLSDHLREHFSWDDCARSVASAIGLAPIGSVDWTDRQYQGQVATRGSIQAGHDAKEIERALNLAKQGRALSEWSVTCTALNYLSDIAKERNYASLDRARRQIDTIAQGIGKAYASDQAQQPDVRRSGRFDVAWRFMAAASGLQETLGKFETCHPAEMMDEIEQDSFLRRELLHYAMKFSDRFDGVSSNVAYELFSRLAALNRDDHAFQTRFARLESISPPLSSLGIFDPTISPAYREEKARCDKIRAGAFDFNDLLADEGALGPTALALSTIDRSLAGRGIDQLFRAGQEHGYVPPPLKWRGDKLLRAALLAAAIRPRALLDFISALARDEEEALRWAAIDLAFSPTLRARLFQASRAGQVDLSVAQLKAALGGVVDQALEAEGCHPWMQREFLNRFQREHLTPALKTVEERFTLTDFPIGRTLIGAAPGEEDNWRFKDLHPEVRSAARKLRDHVQRIMLVMPPISSGGDAQQVSQTSTPPIGLGMIGSRLLSCGHDVHLLDCHRDPSLVDTVLRAASHCQWVGFNVVLPTMRSVLGMAAQIKRSANPPLVVLGGPAVNARALRSAAVDEEELESWDFEICADGTDGFAALVDATAASRSEFAKGIVPNPRSRHVIATCRSIASDVVLDGNNNPVWHEPVVLDRRIFTTSGAIYEPGQTRAHGAAVEAHVVMSRGCDWNCTFCTERKTQSGGERRRSVEAVGAELIELSRRYPDLRIQFVDDNLLPQIAATDSSERKGRGLDWTGQFLDLLDGISGRKRGRFGWRGIFRVEDFLAYEKEIPDFIARLAASGCRMLAFGVEHGDEEHRRKMKAGASASNSEFKDLFERLARQSIHSKAYLVLGGPKETAATSESTIRFALESGVSIAYFAIYKEFVPALKMLAQEQSADSRIHDQYSRYEQLEIGWDDIFIAASNNPTDPALRALAGHAGFAQLADVTQCLQTYRKLENLGFRFADLVKYSDMHASVGPASHILLRVNFGDQELFRNILASAYLRFYLRPEFVETYKSLLAEGY